MKTLVIDDLRSVKPAFEPVTYARTPDAGVVELMMEDWELVCLDHDLGIDFRGKELDIWPCIDFIERHAHRFTQTIFYIITSNPWGADRMSKALKSVGLTAFVIDEVEKRAYFTV